MTSNGWKIDNLCNYDSLSRGTFYVGIATLIFSVVAMIVAFFTIKEAAHDNQLNNKPVQAMNTIFALYSCFISMYQIVISIILVTKRSAFICSVWFVSHVSILTIYLFMFAAKAFVSYNARQYSVTILSVICVTIYSGVFIMFMVIVHNYLVLIR